MDYFQGVVTEYLIADRATFVNTELLLHLDKDEQIKGRHWYCDAAAVNFRDCTFYLCEVTYSKSMAALAKRLLAWDDHWPELRVAICRDCGISDNWAIQPWAFIPKDYTDALKSRIVKLNEPGRLDYSMPYPRITHLESVVPWNYVTWDRKVEALEDQS
jgi:hypothetical protein